MKIKVLREKVRVITKEEYLSNTADEEEENTVIYQLPKSESKAEMWRKNGRIEELKECMDSLN